MNVERTLLTVSEACESLGIGQTVCYTQLLNKPNGLRTVTIGARTLVPVSEIRCWLDRQLGEAESPPGQDNGG